MTQQEVATAMRERGWKWAQATVWSIEKGERPLRLAEAEELSTIVGTSSSNFARPEPLNVVQTNLRRAAVVRGQILESVKAYDAALTELAVSADDVGSDLPNWLREAVSSTLEIAPAEIEAAWLEGEFAAGRAEGPRKAGTFLQHLEQAQQSRLTRG